MFGALGSTDAERSDRRREILSWVERGAPKDEWGSVAPTFTGESTCGACHSTKTDGERRRVRSDLPFETYEQVAVFARPGSGMSIHDLATSSHNHLMGFALVALVTSWIFIHTRWRGAIVRVLVLASPTGAALDVACWWLTRGLGHPFEYGVIVGGGVFGAAVMGMALFSLDELCCGGRVGRLVAPLVHALRLGTRDVT